MHSRHAHVRHLRRPGRSVRHGPAVWSKPGLRCFGRHRDAGDLPASRHASGHPLRWDSQDSSQLRWCAWPLLRRPHHAVRDADVRVEWRVWILTRRGDERSMHVGSVRGRSVRAALGRQWLVRRARQRSQQPDVRLPSARALRRRKLPGADRFRLPLIGSAENFGGSARIDTLGGCTRIIHFQSRRALQ